MIIKFIYFFFLFAFTSSVNACYYYSLHPNGSTTITMKDKGSEKEQITHATIGSGNITVGGESNPDLEGLNRDVSKSQEITKDKITGALDGSMTIDNRVFTSEGRNEIVKQHEEIGDNLAQIGSGLRNNIVVKAIENAITDKNKDLIDTITDYIKQDRQMTELQEKRKDLVAALNGMTNFDSPEAQAILQQVADFVAEGGGFSGDLKLANIDGNIIGFAYQSNDGEVKNITLNMANIDMSDPKALMNALYHETTNFEEHSANEQTAKNRGDTGAGIFGLKNYGNENTNTMSGKEWLESHGGEDTIREGSFGLISDLHNTMTGDGRGETQVVAGTAATIVIVAALATATMELIKEIKELVSDISFDFNISFNKEDSSGQEPKNENNSSGNNGDNNGGDKEPDGFCTKHPKLCLKFDKLSPQDKKSIKSYEKRIQEHKDKLQKFKEDPTVKPGMENRSPNEIKMQQESRIKHLQHEIDVFEKNIEKILENK